MQMFEALIGEVPTGYEDVTYLAAVLIGLYIIGFGLKMLFGWVRRWF